MHPCMGRMMCVPVHAGMCVCARVKSNPFLEYFNRTLSNRFFEKCTTVKAYFNLNIFLSDYVETILKFQIAAQFIIYIRNGRQSS